MSDMVAVANRRTPKSRSFRRLNLFPPIVSLNGSPQIIDAALFCQRHWALLGRTQSCDSHGTAYAWSPHVREAADTSHRDSVSSLRMIQPP